MPAVLCVGGRAGALAPTLRVRGFVATLAPHGDVPMMEAVGLQVAGSRPCVRPLPQTLESMGITWTSVDGTTGADATQLAAPQGVAVEGLAHADGMWALPTPGEDEAAAWARAGPLCT
eukprot:3148773-Pleurochrysis_carterae.AAC.1